MEISYEFIFRQLAFNHGKDLRSFDVERWHTFRRILSQLAVDILLLAYDFVVVMVVPIIKMRN